MSSRQMFSDTIASGAAASTGVNLGGGSWTQIQIQVGTMSTSAALSIGNSVDNGTTFYNLFHAPINSSTVSTNQYFIGSSVGTNGGTVALGYGGYMHLKITATGVVSGGVSFKIICSD